MAEGIPGRPHCAQAALTADVAAFRLQDGRLEVLLIQRGNPPFQGRWALPGGFVDPGEDPRPAAARELKEETGINAPWLLPVGGFADAGRDPRGRTATLAYLTMLQPEDAAAHAGDDAAAAQWWPAEAPPPLAFDHDDMLAQALTRLRHATSEAELLPRLFPRPASAGELARQMGIVWGGTLDEGGTRGRIEALGLLREGAWSAAGLAGLAGGRRPL